jgi:hypothetical protein
MIERLQRALEHIDELSPEAQEDIAASIEEQIELVAKEVSRLPQISADHHLPQRIRMALSAIGSARDLQGDDEFEALDRIRHESQPSPPLQLDDL